MNIIIIPLLVLYFFYYHTTVLRQWLLFSRILKQSLFLNLILISTHQKTFKVNYVLCSFARHFLVATRHRLIVVVAVLIFNIVLETQWLVFPTAPINSIIYKLSYVEQRANKYSRIAIYNRPARSL